MWNYLSAIPPSTFLMLGLLVLAVTMIRRARVYYSQNAERQRIQNAAASGQPQVISERDPKRGLPRTIVQPVTSVTPTFTGEHSPPNVAQWEIRIHEIGRQTVAQINTKLVAMQVMLSEIKRTSDRAESLITELEQLSCQNQNTAAQLQNVSNNVIQTLPPTTEQVIEQVTENIEKPQPSEKVITETPIVTQPTELESIADESIELDSFRSVLDELTQEQSQWRAEMKNLQETIPIPTLPPTPVSSATSQTNVQTTTQTPDDKSSRQPPYQETASRASILRPYPVAGNVPTHTTTRHPELPPLPDVSPLTLPPTKPQTTEHPQFESLFVSTPTRQVSGNKMSPETRQDIFLLSDYGYTANEIAHKVNVPIDEVQRIIKLRTPG